MNKRMILMLLACIVIFGGVFGVQKMLDDGINDFFDNMPMPAATVTAQDAKKTQWARYLSAVGTAEAVNGTLLTTQIPGIVEKIGFQSGETVKEGDVLLELESNTDRAQLRALKAAQHLASSDYQRIQNLHSRGSASKAELDRARSQLDQAAGNLSSQESLIAQKTIRAPFSGELGIRQVNLGDYLSPGNAIVSLQQITPIYVNFKLPENHLKTLHVGQDITATIDASPGEVFSGRITAIEPGIDASTRSINVQAEIANEDKSIRPGMFTRVQVSLGDAEDVTVVPQTAVNYNPYGNAVYVISEVETDQGEKELIVKRRFIKTGRTMGDYIAITEGLEPGETVATSGLLKLSNDTRVIISDEVDLNPQENPEPNNS
ncbi:MAG TPA: efflux RND transporter periplasmic adaptor subunit [Alcanivoracaceae bacterium]|nr:efflux RND transporter periplasmic adaptor subunit [Alcanivoracaceae bacterium]